MSWIRTTLIPLLLFAGSLSFAQAPTAPPDPLDALDKAFISTYTARAAGIAATSPSYVEVFGSSLILHHGSAKPESVLLLTAPYHRLKDIAHGPFAVYLLLAPLSNAPLSNDQVAQIQSLQSKLSDAENGLAAAGFNNDQLKRQREMLDASRDFLQRTLQNKLADPTALLSFARSMTPLMMQNAGEAACFQVQATHTQMMKWKSALTQDEWSRLIAVNKSPHQPRYRNVDTQYFAWLFQGTSPTWAYPGESSRVLYAETIFPPQSVADELTSILVDFDASRAFFGNEWRMSEDVLSDGAARCIAQLPAADREWHAQ